MSASEAEIEVRVRRWDTLGMIVSIACVAHCIAVPLVLGLLPAFGLSFLAKDGLHEVLAVVVLLVAILAFAPGYRVHRLRHVPALGAAGVTLLSGAAFAPGLSLVVESAMTALGGTVLVAAHVLNRRALTRTHVHSH
ncbi:MAG: MerC domain-containing protein [Polyangiaceae bacterium]|nr:MerC domain-containing protein [Polyangiaceae bacterium]MCE7892641.1 MerC domain-containing protein [Sorangiineae bacterium PRO1]MCL4750402.1 MerC family mercury resistance protein [Myxococcales bacterium]